MRRQPHELAVVIVGLNDGHWLPACLGSLQRAAVGVDLDVVLVDNESSDATQEILARDFPWVRTIVSPNHGFAHANNRGLVTCDARFVLFLNADTELRAGTLREVIALMDERPRVGLAGVRQVSPSGELVPTMRRFPRAMTGLSEALGSEHWPLLGGRLGERILDMPAYSREFAADWTSGSFMLVRREALAAAGWFDERFFLFAEEMDLALRIRRAGWEVRHLPQMTILHHHNKRGVAPRFEAQQAFAKRQYALKNMGPVERRVYLGTLVGRYGLRFLGARLDGEHRRARRSAAAQSIRAVLSDRGWAFEEPPQAAVRPFAPAQPSRRRARAARTRRRAAERVPAR